MTFNDETQIVFDDGDVFEYDGDFDFIFFAQFDALRSAGCRFDRYSARTGKEIEKGFAIEAAEYRENGFAHSVHCGTDNAFRTLDLPAF